MEKQGCTPRQSHGDGVFLPQETLTLATLHEQHESDRYRLLALRFQPYDNGLARLMAMLAQEGEQRLESIWQAARRLGVADILASPARQDSGCRGQRHFFIVDETMAQVALYRALQDECRSLDFYKQLCKGASTPELDGLLEGFATQHLTQYQILRENRQRLGSQADAA
jgi:hypothetical protein